jgi:DNA-binding response OmpR family regulator
METIAMTDALTDLKVLVAEEDKATRALLADNLTADGAHVETAQSCGEALKRTYTDPPDLIIADVNGDTLRLIEKVAGEVAIIVLSAEDLETDRVRKLERGADDVVAKPFGYYELRVRAVAVVRRSRAGGRRTLVADAIRVDVAGRRAWLRHEPLQLSRLEFDLLCKLASDPARVFTKDELLRHLWPGAQPSRSTRTLDSHACRLRHKLRAQGDRYLENLWGVGYRLTSPDPARTRP